MLCMDLLRNILQVICDQANSHLGNMDHGSRDPVVLTMDDAAYPVTSNEAPAPRP
jgi:hypothetical protein